MFTDSFNDLPCDMPNIMPTEKPPKPKEEEASAASADGVTAGPGGVKKERPKGWVSLGSEKEVEEARVVPTREFVSQLITKTFFICCTLPPCRSKSNSRGREKHLRKRLHSPIEMPTIPSWNTRLTVIRTLKFVEWSWIWPLRYAHWRELSETYCSSLPQAVPVLKDQDTQTNKYVSTFDIPH